MPVVPVPADSVKSTQPFNFISGLYKLSRSSWAIPYFITRMSLRQAADTLYLVTDLPGSERTAWQLEELFQRDIDWPRVQKQIVPYLKADDRPQFFNALTIALLPIRAREVAKSFDGAGWNPPRFDSQNISVKKHVGAITLGYYGEWSDPVTDSNAELGQIRWNPLEVFAVAIDGQHRLAAIKQFARLDPTAGGRIDVSKVPVILLVLDPALGYQAPADNPILEVLRRLFIDLNKHAVPVNRTRQILLDDYDPHSLCVRSLVESSLPIKEVDMRAPLTKLPLCLVDWHTGEAKIDRGPYLTTVLGLDWAVTNVLGVAPVKDYMDYKAIRKQLDAFKKSLGLKLPRAEKHLAEIEQLSSKPFSYQAGTHGEESELEQIRSAFETVWTPVFVSLFTTLGPYAEVIATRAEQGTLTAEFTNWYYAYVRNQGADSTPAQSEYTLLIENLRHRDQAPLSEAQLKDKLTVIENRKKDEDGLQTNICYLVVFQRALVEAFRRFERLELEAADDTSMDDISLDAMDDIDRDAGDSPVAQGSPDEISTAAKATQVASAAETFIEAMNQVWKKDKQFFRHGLSIGSRNERKHFWQGALLGLDGTVDFTLSASMRSVELILWIPLLAQLKTVCPDVTTFRHVMTKINDDDNDNKVIKALRMSLHKYRHHKNGAAFRIAKANSDDFLDLPDDEKRKRLDAEIEPRLKWAWEQVSDLRR